MRTNGNLLLIVKRFSLTLLSGFNLQNTYHTTHQPRQKPVGDQSGVYLWPPVKQGNGWIPLQKQIILEKCCLSARFNMKDILSGLSQKRDTIEGQVIGSKILQSNLPLQVELLPTLNHISMAINSMGSHLLCTEYHNFWANKLEPFPCSFFKWVEGKILQFGCHAINESFFFFFLLDWLESSPTTCL